MEDKSNNDVQNPDRETTLSLQEEKAQVEIEKIRKESELIQKQIEKTELEKVAFKRSNSYWWWFNDRTVRTVTTFLSIVLGLIFIQIYFNSYLKNEVEYKVKEKEFALIDKEAALRSVMDSLTRLSEVLVIREDSISGMKNYYKRILVMNKEKLDSSLSKLKSEKNTLERELKKSRNKLKTTSRQLNREKIDSVIQVMSQELIEKDRQLDSLGMEISIANKVLNPKSKEEGRVQNLTEQIYGDGIVVYPLKFERSKIILQYRLLHRCENCNSVSIDITNSNGDMVWNSIHLGGVGNLITVEIPKKELGKGTLNVDLFYTDFFFQPAELNFSFNL